MLYLEQRFAIQFLLCAHFNEKLRVWTVIGVEDRQLHEDPTILEQVENEKYFLEILNDRTDRGITLPLHSIQPFLNPWVLTETLQDIKTNKGIFKKHVRFLIVLKNLFDSRGIIGEIKRPKNNFPRCTRTQVYSLCLIKLQWT